MIEIINNLLGGLIDGFRKNFFLAEFPGYFLHQLDAKGSMRTNPVYLLQLFRLSFQNSSQGFESLNFITGIDEVNYASEKRTTVIWGQSVKVQVV